MFQVAWVTKSGNSDLAEPIAIRPTSETGKITTFVEVSSVLYYLSLSRLESCWFFLATF